MNVRLKLIQWTFVALPFLAAAQPKQFTISARTGDTTRPTRHENEEATVEASTTGMGSDGGSLNALPFLNDRPKTSAQISEEIRFLDECDHNFASRPEASDFFASRGWDYIASQQLDTAAHRFNLAWLLNNQNADAYWGIGVVCYQKNRLPDAVRMMRKGAAVADSNTALLTDLATVELKFYQEKPSAELLTEAENHLSRAVNLSPTAQALQKLSLVYFLKADYRKAWAYLHQANSLDMASLDLQYLSELMTKMPDPKGVFK